MQQLLTNIRYFYLKAEQYTLGWFGQILNVLILIFFIFISHFHNNVTYKFLNYDRIKHHNQLKIHIFFTVSQYCTSKCSITQKLICIWGITIPYNYIKIYIKNMTKRYATHKALFDIDNNLQNFLVLVQLYYPVFD